MPAADLPATPPAEAPAVVQTAALAGSAAILWQLEVDGIHYQFLGDPILDQAQARRILERAADPADALLRLSQARKDEGYLFGAVALEQMQGNMVRVRMTAQRIVAVDAPEALRPYFAGLDNRPNLKRATVMRRAALAEVYAARHGKRPHVGFETLGSLDEVRMVVSENPLEDAKAVSLAASVGNHGNRYAGRWLSGASIALRPGRGSEVVLEATQGLPQLSDEAEGSRLTLGRIGFSVVTPLGLLGASFSTLSYRASDQASFLGTNGEGRPVFAYEQGTVHTLKLSAEQIVYAGEQSRWSISETWTRSDDDSKRVVYVGDAKQGSEPLRKERYDSLSLGLNFSVQEGAEAQRSTLKGSVSVTQGLSGDFKGSSPQAPSSTFSLGQLGVAYERPFVLGTRAGLAFSGQWSDDVLPEAQKLVLGGFSNLTAWLPGVATGDRGGLARATLAVSDQDLGPFKLSVGLFYEAGYAEAVAPAADEEPEKFLSDVGVGVVAKSKNLSLSVGYAEPLAVNGVSEATQSEHRAQLLMSLSARW